MSFRKIIFAQVLLTLAFLLGALSTRAQDQNPEPPEGPPRPVVRSNPIPLIDSTVQDDNNNGALKPDSTPVTGVQEPTLGSPETLHSYWMPGIQYASSIQSIGQGSAPRSWVVSHYVIGNISLLKAWRRSQFSVNYSAGGSFSTDRAQGTGWYQELALSQTFTWSRWNVQFLDQFSYLPQSQFGFGGGTGLGVGGADPGGVVIPPQGGNYVPNQSIFISFGPRYSNASTIQATYQTSPRGSITASGTYGLLNFVEKGNIDNSSAVAGLGYNYTLTRESSIGVDYRFTGYHYVGQPQALGSHVIGVAYSRKLTGRLALNVNGGPQITTFRCAPQSQRTCLVPVAGQSQKIGANISGGFTYAIPNGGVTGGYLHGLTGGGGVFTGSSTDQMNLGAHRRLTRVWDGHLNLGYAHNSAIGNLALAARPAFNSWFAGGGVSRPFGRNFTFAAAYNVNLNRTSGPTCIGKSCFPNETVHFITLNFQYHTRPYVLQ